MLCEIEVPLNPVSKLESALTNNRQCCGNNASTITVDIIMVVLREIFPQPFNDSNIFFDVKCDQFGHLFVFNVRFLFFCGLIASFPRFFSFFFFQHFSFFFIPHIRIYRNIMLEMPSGVY